ncbi:MAG: thiamine pyrophosphate-binding protein, partial [Gammaproteobacteria bacterium]|nr:thiamine pyrophosphate-binding protein [Gammaproteobacteria bacterium]
MTELTGGDAVYETLRALGVCHVFGIPSVHNLPIFDAITRGGDIEPIIVRNEQAAAHSADGYARASGKLGVILASTGPGTTNTVTGLYEASFASSGVLLITGQVDSVYYRKGKGPGHQADNQVQMLQSVVRHVESVRHTQTIPAAINRAVAAIQEGRPQPAAVEIPIDLQYARADMTIPPAPETRPLANIGDIEQAATLLAEANKRVIIAGGGAQGAAAQVTALAVSLGAPVFTSVNGRGVIPEDHELSMGSSFAANPMRKLLEEADVVLAIGTWFHGGPHNWNINLSGKLIHIDIDPHSHGLVFDTAINIIGDAGDAVEAIAKRLNANPGDADYTRALARARDEISAGARKRLGEDTAAIMDHMRNQMGRDDVLVRDMTIPAYLWANQFFPIFSARRTMNPTSGAIGPGLPLANGAALASQRKTVLIQGDGGFMVHIGELTTTVQYNLPLVICVFTDGGYGVLRGFQTNQFEGRLVGVNLVTPNFTGLANSVGMAAEAVSSVAGFE